MFHADSLLVVLDPPDDFQSFPGFGADLFVCCLFRLFCFPWPFLKTDVEVGGGGAGRVGRLMKCFMSWVARPRA